MWPNTQCFPKERCNFNSYNTHKTTKNKYKNQFKPKIKKLISTDGRNEKIWKRFQKDQKRYTENGFSKGERKYKH